MKFVDLGTKALRTVGVIGQGVPAAPEDMQIAFDLAVDMFDSWAVKRLTVFQTLRNVFPIVGGKGSPANPYTIGLGGDLNIPRPNWISDAAVLIDSTVPPTERQLRVLEDSEYAAITLKDMPSTLVERIHFSGKFNTTGIDVALGQVFLHPVPNGTMATRLVLYIPTPMSGFADLATTEYLFPPGYAEALHRQLAKRCAVEYERPWSPESEQLAVEAFAIIQRPNATIPKLRADYGLPGSGNEGYYDWRTGLTTGRGR